jgi:serine/threonine-protein kinase RsbT
MTEVSIKGSLLLSTLAYVEKFSSGTSAARVKQFLHDACDGHILLSSQWYPRALLTAFVNMAEETASPMRPFSRRELGAFWSRNLLDSTYITLKKDSPRAMATTLPLLYSCLFMDLRLTARSEGASAALFVLDGKGVVPGDLESHMGMTEGAIATTGAVEIQVAAGPPPKPGALALRVKWGSGEAAASDRILVRGEPDIAESRERVRRVARQMAFGPVDIVGLATCASELARNIVNYAGEGIIHVEEASRQGARCIRIRAEDRGSGIPNLEQVLAGKHRSERGMGKGLIAIKRLSDEFHVQTAPVGGTTVEIIKYLRRP